jgi:hypothetical protein
MNKEDFRNLYRRGWFTYEQVIFKFMTSFRMSESEAIEFLSPQSRAA